MVKTIAVFGATGHQGGAVARALARDPVFNVLGITREGSRPEQIEKLERNNVVIKYCDLDNFESICSVLGQVDGCFVVTYTDFLNDTCIDNETRWGRNIADACAASNVPHVIYSTQLHTRKITGIEVRNMVAKAEVEEYMKNKRLELTRLMVPCYYENLLDYLKPERTDANSFKLEIPVGTVPLDLISVEDIGDVVKHIFNNRDFYLDKTVSVSGDKITVREMAAVLSRALHPLVFKERQLTVNEYKQKTVPWARDFGNMFEFFLRFDHRYNKEDSKKINPDVKTFQQWVQHNAASLKAEFSKI